MRVRLTGLNTKNMRSLNGSIGVIVGGVMNSSDGGRLPVQVGGALIIGRASSLVLPCLATSCLVLPPSQRCCEYSRRASACPCVHPQVLSPPSQATAARWVLKVRNVLPGVGATPEEMAPCAMVL